MGTYLLFDCTAYYPAGGMEDLREAFAAGSDAEAIERAQDILDRAASAGPFEVGEFRQLVHVAGGEVRTVFFVEVDRETGRVLGPPA